MCFPLPVSMATIRGRILAAVASFQLVLLLFLADFDVVPLSTLNYQL